MRRAGARLRINAGLVDAATDFPLWSERYDREMKDVFEVQDEIAQKIAAALRITLSPQEQQALLEKPTEDLQAYDLYLRGRNYARRVGRQDLQYALQMYENAVALDPGFALAHAGLANVCAEYYYHFERQQQWIDRAIAATKKASANGSEAPEIKLAEAWVLFVEGRYDEAAEKIRALLSHTPDLDGGYYLPRPLTFCSREIPGCDRHHGGCAGPRWGELQHARSDSWSVGSTWKEGRFEELRTSRG